MSEDLVRLKIVTQSGQESELLVQKVISINGKPVEDSSEISDVKERVSALEGQVGMLAAMFAGVPEED